MAISSVGGNGSYADSNKTESTTRNMQAPASSTLTMDNFMLLLAAELQNQDMSSPMSNSEMMQQLTSMATVQSMNTFSELSSTQYALSLMGQKVKVASTNQTTGKMEMIDGEISGVNLSTMKLYIKGSDVAYGLGNIMEVGDVPQPKKDEDKDKDKDNVGDKDDNTEDPPKVEDPPKTDQTSPNDTTEDNTKSNNSARSRAAAYATDPRVTDNDKNNIAAAGVSDENSRTEPVTGRTARRVAADNSTEPKAVTAADYGSSTERKTYTETRALRMEYLASDKREALERQNEIPEDKRLILASRSASRNARGPAAESYTRDNTARTSSSTSDKTVSDKITLDPRRI